VCFALHHTRDQLAQLAAVEEQGMLASQLQLEASHSLSH
jgi:hypothetical protein